MSKLKTIDKIPHKPLGSHSWPTLAFPSRVIAIVGVADIDGVYYLCEATEPGTTPFFLIGGMVDDYASACYVVDNEYNTWVVNRVRNPDGRPGIDGYVIIIPGGQGSIGPKERKDIKKAIKNCEV